MSESRQKILVVDDDPKIRSILVDSFSQMGFDVDEADDGQSGFDLAADKGFCLIVLDVGLPKLSGVEICRRLRGSGVRTPILMLTARADEVDKVLSLELGADDYVTKPFSIREVEARVNALLRRVYYDKGETAETAGEQLLVFGPLEIDIAKHEVRVDHQPIALTALEFRLLTFFASRPGVTVTRDTLVDAVWGYEVSNFGSSITSQVSRLRLKIEADPANPLFIKTVHGVGYRFAEATDFAS